MKELSVVVPAHCEEKMIGYALDALMGSLSGYDAEVIVSCNGCDDGTAKIARAHPLRPTVLEISDSSKTLALNEAEAVCTTFPRIYLDADVAVDANCVRYVVETFSRTNANLVVISARTNTEQSSLLVKAYYRFWLSLPYVGKAGVGAGVFALSANGRARFGPFPNIIADDEFVRRHFAASEMSYCEEATAVVEAPRNYRSLLATKIRGRVGAYQLSEMFPQLLRRGRSADKIAAVKDTLLGPERWLDAAIYCATTLLIRVGACIKMRGKSGAIWYQDRSTRTG